MTGKFFRCVLALTGFCTISFCAQGEEGFWLHSAPPRAQWQRDYGFKPSAAWLSNLLRATARFNSGGNSGFFASEDGLFVTNFHIGRPMVRMLANGSSHLESGFYALDPDESLKIPYVEVRSPESIEDVTAKVLAAVPENSSIEIAAAARDRVIAEIESQSQKKTGLHSVVVELYSGARYELYRYRIYTDIRLVFTPEAAVGFMDDPGDTISPEEPDSFNLDVCVFRIYDKGKPAKIKHHLRLSTDPVQPDDLLIASGDPAGSARHDTLAQLKFQRDVVLPLQIERDRRIETALADAGERDGKAATRLASRLGSIRSRRLLSQIRLDALQSERFMVPKIRSEKQLTDELGKNPFEQIEKALAPQHELYPMYFLLAMSAGFNSDALAFAGALNQRNSKGGIGGARKQEAFLSTSRMTDVAYERIRLTAWLDMLTECLGYDDPIVQTLLRGQSPQTVVDALIKQTRILDPEHRKSLLNEASTELDDPLLVFARILETEAKKISSRYWTQQDIVDGVQAEIVRTSFKLPGKLQYPDATNTQRIAYGVLKGREENGQQLPAWSTFGQMGDFIANQARRQPLTLPNRWHDKRLLLDANTPLNLFTTIDAVGGTSGTPVVNRKGEVVGVSDAGNLDRTASIYFYTDIYARTIVVSSLGIIEALRKIYGANDLADELTRGRR